MLSPPVRPPHQSKPEQTKSLSMSSGILPILSNSGIWISFIAALTDSFFSYGALTLVTFAAQGEMKTPIPQGEYPSLYRQCPWRFCRDTPLGTLFLRIGNQVWKTNLSPGEPQRGSGRNDGFKISRLGKNTGCIETISAA